MSAPPCSSTFAVELSGAPNEKPTFLKAQAKPRPRLRYGASVLPSEVRGGRDHPPEVLLQPAASAHFSTTVPIDTPLGSGVPTESRAPSRRRLRARISTGSIPSFSARRLICDSAAKAPCGPPKPRNAPPGILFVYTEYASTFTFGISYGPVHINAAFPSTLAEV